MSWTVVWATATSWRWGDIAAWVGAAVNLLVVLVALSPIRTAKRERAARGRLVAASLHFPARITYRLLELVANSLSKLVPPGATLEGPEYDQLVRNLSDANRRVHPLLSRFNIPEVSCLDQARGEKLARTVGKINGALPELLALVNELEKASRLESTERVRSARARALEGYDDFRDTFRSTAESMGEFAAYCDGLFQSVDEVAADRFFWPRQFWRRARALARGNSTA